MVFSMQKILFTGLRSELFFEFNEAALPTNLKLKIIVQYLFQNNLYLGGRKVIILTKIYVTENAIKISFKFN